MARSGVLLPSLSLALVALLFAGQPCEGVKVVRKSTLDTLKAVRAAFANSDDYKTVGAVIRSSGFATVLRDILEKRPGLGFTIFAPSDAAFTTANLNADSFPCKADITPARLNRYFRTVLGVHVVVGRFRASKFVAVNSGSPLNTFTAVRLTKTSNDPLQVGILSGTAGSAYTSATIEKPDLAVGKKFAIHGISDVLQYPFQWTGF